MMETRKGEERRKGRKMKERRGREEGMRGLIVGRTNEKEGKREEEEGKE